MTYLNLGRAYQKLGNCDQARDAFDRALSAPRVEQPSPAFVQRKVSEYRAELDAQCPASNEADASESTAEDPQNTEAPADVQDDDEAAASGTAGEASGDEAGAPVKAPPKAEQSSPLAWAVTLSGLAIMAGGGAMFGLAAAERNKVRSQPDAGQGVVTERTMREAADIESRANTYDTIGVATFAGGAIITGLGAYLFLSASHSCASGRRRASRSEGALAPRSPPLEDSTGTASPSFWWASLDITTPVTRASAPSTFTTVNHCKLDSRPRSRLSR